MVDVDIEEINRGWISEAETIDWSGKTCFRDNKFDGPNVMLQVYN